MGRANFISILMFLIFYLGLCINSVTLESNNAIHMQNNTLECDHQCCF